jgi:folate-binding protein YgfZ
VLLSAGVNATPSPLLSTPGAVPADGPDAGVAAHYGDPMREQRLLARGEAFVDLSHRGVVRVSGPDRLSWLHSLLSQHVEALAPGVPTQALLLSPHGHVEQHLRLVDDGTATWATLEPGRASAFVDFLRSMQFLLRVQVDDVSADWAVVWTPAGERLVPAGELPDMAGAMGAPAGVWAYEALRIARGEPRLGLDTDHKTIPNEVGWLDDAVHLDKGCYRGQETVARVHTLGRPPRRLTRLHLDGSVDHLPSHCDRVVVSGTDREIGFVGSAARHYEDGPIALALLKRTVPVDVPLVVRSGPVSVAASQEVVVDPEAGLHVRARLS